jgi:hypothetical protein
LTFQSLMGLKEQRFGQRPWSWCTLWARWSSNQKKKKKALRSELNCGALFHSKKF